MYKRVNLLCAITGVLTVLLLIAPTLCSVFMSANLANGVYEAHQSPAENISELSRILPLGYTAFSLIAVGVIVTSILLLLRKPVYALFGIGACVAADTMLVFFTVALEKLFPYNPLDAYQRGLTFWDLVLRYYSLIIPTLMLIVAVSMCFAAHKKQEVADVMKNAADTSSTLMLDEEESTLTLS